MSQERFLLELRERRWTRDDAALGYALLLGKDDVDWPKVNRAIIERWSLNALEYIKRGAWKMAAG